MIESLKLENVGPKDELSLTLGSRMNVFTGDNGLGKSFLLDIIWWALTRTWPNIINTKVNSGYIAKPRNIKKKATIEFKISGKTGKVKPYSSNYSPKEESWIGKQGRPINPGLVIYTMSDGSFALWDPARNYWITKNGLDTQERVSAYIFSQQEVWEGLKSNGRENKSNQIFEGLIRDWALWQASNSIEFQQLKSVLQVLSPPNEELVPGSLGKLSLEDERKIPSIKTANGDEVLLYHLSSGMKRIITLAYFLVYVWQKHCENAEFIGENPTKQIILLVDEMEAHLHPKWQRNIVPTLLNVMNALSTNATVQLITATHSPLVMASLEPFFDEAEDAWFDFDLLGNVIEIKKMQFQHFGTAENWLTSEAFNLDSTRATKIEELINEANDLISNERAVEPTIDEIEVMRQKLASVLDPKDRFLFRWRYICEQKGWLK